VRSKSEEKRLKSLRVEYDRLINTRLRDLGVKEEDRVMTDREFTKIENRLNNENIKLLISLGHGSGGEGFMCRRCKRIFPYARQVRMRGQLKHFDYSSCSQHEGREAL